MTVKYHCDGPECSDTMTRKERRIAITLEEPAPEPRWCDPAEDDGPLPEIEIEVMEFYSDGDFHFCSDACLTAWAMSRALDQ